ncbi:MAG: hypothetical protein MUC71_01710 [Steroidobacteraceae bacterium]|jgi:hypothetical protein|nr:hypothetical protein [Steroidobacteraceae bacterium]
MTLQQPLALAPPVGAADWSQHQLLDPRTLRGLASLNEAFLRLLFETQLREPGQPAFGLAPELLPPPTPAPRAAAVLAGLPGALFDLRFRDIRLWQQVALRGGAVADGQRPAPAEPALAAFTRAALSFAWHLAQARDRPARLLLGMEPATAHAIAEVPVGLLDGLALGLAPQLEARFCGRPCFWMAVRDCLRIPSDAVRRARLRRLALQLQGADSARGQQLQRRVRLQAQV